ncbi:hypothetical protein [Massilibacteroides sp.]|uniref:hypothetical protein n=1 Tax=Massilibacteroides sp. TaxID=2034766 RepID=UPI00262ED932|nr:hypothetical protein [Massilibacteroides sp.]MDD4514789.1 hypothetical protein [Massilibacteroides sp.]
MKKVNITTALLLVYLLVIGVLFWPGNNPNVESLQYWGVLGGTLFIIIVLRIIQIKRLKLRDKWRRENEETRSDKTNH